MVRVPCKITPEIISIINIMSTIIIIIIIIIIGKEIVESIKIVTSIITNIKVKVTDINEKTSDLFLTLLTMMMMMSVNDVSHDANSDDDTHSHQAPLHSISSGTTTGFATGSSITEGRRFRLDAVPVGVSSKT